MSTTNNKVGGKKIQLPKDGEAKRCVLIVIENHIGVILKIVTERKYEYAVVAPYHTKRKVKTYTHLDGSVCCSKCNLTKDEGCKHNI